MIMDNLPAANQYLFSFIGDIFMDAVDRLAPLSKDGNQIHEVSANKQFSISYNEQ